MNLDPAGRSSHAMKSGKLAWVEAARGSAAVLVVFVHASSMLSGPKDFGYSAFAGLFSFGHAGVDFFFVLSGFIILHTHFHELGRADAAPTYLWKRIVRLFPSYWVCLALYGAAYAVSPSATRFEQDAGVIATSILLIPHPAQLTILSVSWTLHHELLFYLLFLTLFFSIRAGIFIFGAWAALCIFHAATGAFGDYPWSFAFRFFNLEFLVGLGVAYLVRVAPAPDAWRILVPGGVAVFLGAGLYESWGPPSPTEWLPLHAAYAVGSGMVLYGLVTAERNGSIREAPRWALAIGSASYSIYLLHVLTIMVMQQVFRRLSAQGISLTAEMGFVLAASAAILSGWIFFRVVEQPLLRYCRKRFVPRKALRAANAQ